MIASCDGCLLKVSRRVDAASVTTEGSAASKCRYIIAFDAIRRATAWIVERTPSFVLALSRWNATV